MGPCRCLLLALLAVSLHAQQQQFMEYVERRLTLLEVGSCTPLCPAPPYCGAPGPSGSQRGWEQGRVEEEPG